MQPKLPLLWQFGSFDWRGVVALSDEGKCTAACH
jgi:hypothetical protein